MDWALGPRSAALYISLYHFRKLFQPRSPTNQHIHGDANSETPSASETNPARISILGMLARTNPCKLLGSIYEPRSYEMEPVKMNPTLHRTGPLQHFQGSCAAASDEWFIQQIPHSLFSFYLTYWKSLCFRKEFYFLARIIRKQCVCVRSDFSSPSFKSMPRKTNTLATHIGSVPNSKTRVFIWLSNGFYTASEWNCFASILAHSVRNAALDTRSSEKPIKSTLPKCHFWGNKTKDDRIRNTERARAKQKLHIPAQLAPIRSDGANYERTASTGAPTRKQYGGRPSPAQTVDAISKQQTQSAPCL